MSAFDEDFAVDRGFASDNYSGVHPEVLAAVAAANHGHASSYGGDPWTARFADLAKRLFGEATEAYPVFNGTGANVIALQSVAPRWGAVVCAKSSHIATDEGGAPEKVGGLKLWPVDTPDGKLTPELIDREAWGFGNEHRPQPVAVSISQTTEFGTCYTAAELRAIADHTHDLGMVLHIDGSRLGNAAAFLDTSLAAITSEVGADILSLGGTKNGLLGAEAVIALRPEAAPGLRYLRKTNMQLGSKMRFISAQLIAMYEGELWLRSARRANAMARRLSEGIHQLIETGAVPGLELELATESNAVFPKLPADAKARAHERFHFYDWPGDPSMVRLMCSFDTTEEDVDALLAAIAGE